MTHLQLDNVTRYFGGLAAVKNVSFDVQPGQIVGLIGPNGSGKTTCFNLIAGVYAPTSGRIIHKGESIGGMPSYKVARRGIARTFQISSYFPALTALENVVTAHHTQLKSGLVAGILGLSKTAKEEEAATARSSELLGFVGLEHRRYERADVLSSAEQRRLMVAMALAARPELLLLDEPSAGMTKEDQSALVQLIRKVRDSGITIVLVEHHMKLIMGVCDKIVVLNNGLKIAEGVPAEIQSNQAVIEAYLGRGGDHG
jgi:branched-chain amino acid transport system ATP-binding protein